MNPEAQQSVTAAECGWKPCQSQYPCGGWHSRNNEKIQNQPPDYLNDLNAAAEFVKHLTTMGWRCQMNNGLDTTWECELFRPIQPSTHHDNIGSHDGEKMEIHYGAGDTLASAICESGLRVLGKWIE